MRNTNGIHSLENTGIGDNRNALRMYWLTGVLNKTFKCSRTHKMHYTLAYWSITVSIYKIYYT